MKMHKPKLNEERKTLVSNFVSLSLLQIAGYVFPLLTVPYLAHVIGVDRYGEIAFAAAVMVYFQTIVDYGFIFSAVRDIARCRDDKEQVASIYSNVMWSRIMLLFCSLCLLLLVIALVPKLFAMKWVLLASFLMVVGHTFFPDWMFQAVEKMKYITIFNVVVKLLFTIAVFAFIHKPDDYILQPVFTSLGYLISGVGAMWLIHSWGIRMQKPKLSLIIKSLKSNVDLFINQLVPNLYNSASVLLLGFFHGDAANGVFDAGNRFNTAGTSLLSILSRTFYPFLSRRMDKHELYSRFNLCLSAFVSVSLFAAAPWIIDTFFPSDFDGAVAVLRILSVSLFFLSLSNVYGTNYLILKGHEREMRKITLYSSIIGLVVAIPATLYWSYFGVAVTIAFSRALIGIWSWLKAKSLKSR